MATDIHNEMRAYIHELETLLSCVEEYTRLDLKLLTPTEQQQAVGRLQRQVDRALEAKRLIGHAVKHKCSMDVDSWPYPPRKEK